VVVADDGSGGDRDLGNNNGNVIPYAAALSQSPKDLYVLWEEYEFGIQGRKAAKRFSTKERGHVRYKFHQRKVVWDKIAQMIRQGHTYLTAIDEIYRVYGESSTVTEIINRMRTDRMAGGHRHLR
jgi:Transcriptional activator of glycolytic enzymes